MHTKEEFQGFTDSNGEPITEDAAQRMADAANDHARWSERRTIASRLTTQVPVMQTNDETGEKTEFEVPVASASDAITFRASATEGDDDAPKRPSRQKGGR